MVRHSRVWVVFFSCGDSRWYARPEEQGCGSGLQAGLSGQVGRDQEIFAPFSPPLSRRAAQNLAKGGQPAGRKD